MIRIEKVSSKKQLKAFVDFPHDHYSGNANYVPELFIAQRDLLTPGKHPFHDHSVVQPFLAWSGNKIVGRIAAIENRNHNSFNGVTDGFFGFFEVIDDMEVAKALLNEVKQWLIQRGLTTIVGPVNFSSNETCGMLINGFDSPPFAMMTYNKPYYKTLLEKLGFAKKVDLIAHQFSGEQKDQRPVKLLEVLTQRLNQKGITIRSVNLKDFKNEVERILSVYNSAWDKNLGFVPMTREEFEYLAKDLKLLLDTDFCLVAESENKIVGFALAIPNINEILINVKRGRLFPVGIFKLLFGLRKIKSVRVIALGVIEGFRKRGIESCFYASFLEAYQRKKYTRAEASWILENNSLMNNALHQMNAVPYKTYRIFEQAI
jgi:GNAT superfamily N-acetyltransferase